MNLRNLLILLLIMATVAVDLVLGKWVRTPLVPDEASFSFQAYLALVFAQLSFVAGWIVFGRRNLIARCLVATLALWMLAWPLAGSEGIIVTRPLYVLGTFLFMVATPLAGLRLTGFRITPVEDLSRDPPQVESGAVAQFSLGSIIALTTVFCLALGVAPDVDITGLQFARIVVYLFPFVFTALASLWSVFSFQHRWLRLVLAFALCPAITSLVEPAILPRPESWACVISAVAEANLVLFASYVLLTAGFRLTRIRSSLAASPLSRTLGRGGCTPN